MNVLHLSQWLSIAIFALCSVDVAGQFTAALPTCPGDTFTFRCTVGGDMSGETTWIVGGSSECSLQHRSTSSSICGPSDAFIARPRTGFGTSATSFTSTLGGTAIITLDDTLVECFSGTAVNSSNRVGGNTLQILGPPSVPTLSCVELSEDVSGTVNVTVSWTLSGGDNADFYLINITTNAPHTPYEGLLNITTASVTQRELTGFRAGYEYNITVRGVNCGSQEGNESEPLTIRPQVPTTPTHLNVCAVYDVVKLQNIESSWNELNPVTVSENCANGRDIRASYQLLYATDSDTSITTCVVSGTECSNGTCHHELQNNTADSRCQPPVSQFSGEDVTVSVTAKNIVGGSNPAGSGIISGTNVHLLNVSVDGAFVKCTFHLPGYTCTIDYGTDPSYINLAHRDTSSTLGQTTNITLPLELERNTTYYYIVSAESRSQCVRVRGRFKIECILTDIGITTRDDSMDPRCKDRRFADSSSISGGVVCYDGTNEGSTAVYICNNDTQRDEVTRVCQSDGTWTGSIPMCIITNDGLVVWHIILIVIGVIVVVIAILLLFHEACHFWKKCGSNQHSCTRKDRVKLWSIVWFVTAAILCVIGVLLWITSVVVVVNPSNSIWQHSRDGLTISAFITTILATTVVLVCVYHSRRHPKKNKKTNGNVESIGLNVNKEVDNNANEMAYEEEPTGRTVTETLHNAARRGDLKEVKLVLAKKTDINNKDDNGMTPLHTATKRGHMETVGYLIDQGARIDINEMSSLHVAAKHGRVETVEYLVDEKEVEINIKDNDGQTPLHLAIRKSQEYTAKCLVKKGADINIKDNNGMIPLHVAAEKGCFRIAEYLLGKDVAAINITDNSGMTPLHVATKHGHVETVRYLVDQGARSDIKNLDGWTPMHTAAEEGYVHTTRCLVERGADIWSKDKDGLTPLHVAARHGRVATVKYLVDEKGVDINIKDNDGRTPLKLAVEGAHNKVVECLQRAGVKRLDAQVEVPCLDEQDFPDGDQVEMREPKTAEYQTFFRNQSKIANLISNSSGSIDRIAAVLYAKKIVGTAAIDAADNYGPDVNERVRVKAVLKEILESIKADKKKYYKMRSVLLSKDIIPGLAQCLPEVPTHDTESMSEATSV